MLHRHIQAYVCPPGRDLVQLRGHSCGARTEVM